LLVEVFVYAVLFYNKHFGRSSSHPSVLFLTSSNSEYSYQIASKQLSNRICSKYWILILQDETYEQVCEKTLQAIVTTLLTWVLPSSIEEPYWFSMASSRHTSPSTGWLSWSVWWKLHKKNQRRKNTKKTNKARTLLLLVLSNSATVERNKYLKNVTISKY